MGSKTKVFHVLGDKRNPEPSEHRIEFPGGSISLARTSTDTYWVHINLHHDELLEDVATYSKRAQIVNSRVDRDWPAISSDDIPHHDDINHIAVEVSTRGEI